MQVKKLQLELAMEQWTGSKLTKECVKAESCHSVESFLNLHVLYISLKAAYFFSLILRKVDIQ